MELLKDIFKEYKKYENKQIELGGWVRTNRAQKEFGFINLNDGTSLNNVQVVYEQNLKNFEKVQKLISGSSIKVKGKVVLTPDRNQDFEVKATEIEILCQTDETYPIQPKRHTREFLREQAYLRPRTNLFNAVFRMRSVLAFAIHKFFQEKGFVYVNSPLITSNDGEGAGELFTVTTKKEFTKNTCFKDDFFGKRAYLTVTGQLQAEAYAQAFRNVYTFGPTFRAENSNTQKHASEFWMIEPEMAFCDLEGDMNIAEEMVKYLIKEALEKLPEEMKLFDSFVEKGLIERLNVVLNNKFNRVTHAEAIEILQKSKVKFENKPEQGKDLASEHEKYLTDVYFKSPVFITNWPKEIKAFYMRLNDDKKTVAAVDLLVSKSGELIGGSQREERLEYLEKRMKELKMNPEGLEWYVNLRKFGGTTSSGFGLGFERLLMFITGVENIRDVIPFPRTPKNLEY